MKLPDIFSPKFLALGADELFNFLAEATLARPAIEAIPDIIEWCEQVSGNRLDPWQRAVLTSTAQYFLFNCSRQVGKTEVVALKASFRARWLKRTVVAIAPSFYQSNKIRVRAERFLRASGISKFKTANATTLELPDGGSVIALPGDRPDLSARSETTDDLIIDEASRVKDALIAAASPTTATRPNSTTTYLSTPAGKRGAFYRAWTDASGVWEKYSIKATECPRISPTFLAKQRTDLGPLLFAQEFECEFVADSTAVLDPEAIARMFRQGTMPVPDAVDWLREQASNVDWVNDAANAG